MASTTIEDRVAELERLVDKLMQRSGRSTEEKDWRRTVGMFDSDEIMKEIIEEGRRIRVRGWLAWRNGPQIEATHPEQIEVVE